MRSPILIFGLAFFGLFMIAGSLGLNGEPGYQDGGPGGFILGLLMVVVAIDRYRRTRA